jgi:DNA-directed RNA polymerase subunit RPC12/RpoP
MLARASPQAHIKYISLFYFIDYMTHACQSIEQFATDTYRCSDCGKAFFVSLLRPMTMESRSDTMRLHNDWQLHPTAI